MPETRRQPYLVLCASSLDTDTAWQFADAIDKSGTVPVTLVAPASSAAAHFPEAEILNASLTDPQHLHYTGIAVTVQRLDHAAYVQITTALKVSGQPAHPAQGPCQDIPAEPGSPPHAEPPSPEDSSAPTTATATSPVLTAADDTNGQAFPALLAATTDPAGLSPLPATTMSAQADEAHTGSAFS